MIQSRMNLRTKPYICRTVVPLSRCVMFNLTATVCAWGGGCGEVGVGVGWYGCRCGEVGVGVGMENPTLVQNFTYLEPDSIISSLFVQSVIFGHSLCFLLNKLEGVGKCVCPTPHLPTPTHLLTNKHIHLLTTSPR